MTEKEFEELEIAIEKITKKIFETYTSLAELEIEKNMNTTRYQEEKENLRIYTELENRLYQKMVKNPYWLQVYFNKISGTPEYQMDIWSYALIGKMDSLYYTRIPRQLERTVHFKDVRMELESGYKVTGPAYLVEQFHYTMYGLLNSLDQEINYKKLLSVETYLQQEPLTDEEIKYFTRLKYYYIFKNAKAESIYLDANFDNQKGFKEEKSRVLYILEQAKNQPDVFNKIYNARFFEELRNRLKPTIEHWCSYSDYNLENRKAQNLFLGIELDAVLDFLDSSGLEEAIRFTLQTAKNMRFSDNLLGRYYGLNHILERINEKEQKLNSNKELKKEYQN